MWFFVRAVEMSLIQFQLNQFQWSEEEDEEEEEKARPKGRGNARNAVSKTGRPRRSTAGRGKGER